MTISTHKKVDKAYAKLKPDQRAAVKQALAAFETNHFDSLLHDQSLKGRLLGLRAFSAAWDLRIIYREEGGFITILLLDVGTHNQVYQAPLHPSAAHGNIHFGSLDGPISFNAVGKRNRLFVGCPDAGKRSAVMHTLLINARNPGSTRKLI